MPPRKNSAEYSQHEKSSANRERCQKKTGVTLELWKAQSADRNAWYNAKKKLKETAEWKDASAEAHENIERVAKEALLSKRFKQGKSREFLEQKLMKEQREAEEEEKKRRGELLA